MVGKKPDSDSDGSDSEDKPNQPPQKQETMPEKVDYFLGNLLKALQTRNVSAIHKLYEDDFNKLSQDYYKKESWPSFQLVSDSVSSEPLFLILYKELYYRHVYSIVTKNSRDSGVPFAQRKGSWENYCRLLDLIISDMEDGDELSVVLPAQWIWDILDEFVYHYQVYCAFRSKSIKAGKDEVINEIKENPDVFETKTVLVYLHKLVRASKVEEYLVNKEGGTMGAFVDETSRLLGYFSLMQLLRVHSLLGDYHLAMKTISKIDLHEEVPLFYKIPACHVTLYYYMGFAYMMMRRYADAIRTFSDILVFLSKTTSGVNPLSYQHEAMVRKRDSMYALLLISLALCPRPIDESLEKNLREPQYADRQARLQRGEELAFEELFSYACPKFVSAAPPNFDNLEGFNGNEAHHRQLNIFKKEMKQQQFLPRIGSYMKLYTAIKTTKLAQLCEMAPDDLRDQLMCVMHKTSQKVRTKGPPLDGETELCGEVEFYLDGDSVHINAQRTERAHADVFLEQILKFQDLLKKMGPK